MTQQKKHVVTHQHSQAGPDGDPFDENAGDLRQQAASYANIARQARDDCQRGADAEKELERRRNRSGQ